MSCLTKLLKFGWLKFWGRILVLNSLSWCTVNCLPFPIHDTMSLVSSLDTIA